VRDYRDNIRSYQKVNFDLNHTAALAERWKYYNKQIKKQHDELGDRSILIKYEELLQESERVIQRTCQFLEVSFKSSMLEFYEGKDDLKGWQKNLKKPIDPSKAFKWKKQMSSADIAIADHICGDVGQTFGYEVNEKKLSLWKQLRILPAQFQGKLSNWLEKIFFSLPLWLKSPILHYYRKKTKSLG
jgi:hypothetical protein